MVDAVCPTGLWLRIKMLHECKTPSESSKEPIHLCHECLLSTPGPGPGSLATNSKWLFSFSSGMGRRCSSWDFHVPDAGEFRCPDLLFLEALQ